MFGTIFVFWADNLDGSNQTSTPSCIVNSDFVFVVIRQFRFDCETRSSWSPLSRRHSSVSTSMDIVRRGIVFYERRDIDFNLRSRVNVWTRDIPVWELLTQVLHDYSRPLTVQFFPRSDVIHRRPKVIS